MVEKREFVEVALNLKYEIFVVYIATLIKKDPNDVHPSKKAQITYLKVDKALTEIFDKYKNFEDVFFPKLAAELPEHSINNHAIELIDNR